MMRPRPLCGRRLGQDPTQPWGKGGGDCKATEPQPWGGGEGPGQTRPPTPAPLMCTS